MLGLFLIIVVSGMLLYFIEKKNITVLGIVPNRKHSTQFLIGFVFIVLVNLLWIYIDSVVRSVEWQLNSRMGYQSVFDAFVYHLRSALTEDLVFRGAILYILISKIGSKKAILISASIFGIYHLFSYGMTGGAIISIIYVTLVTGFTGYVWAYSFDKTKSIALGLGFHLGSNLLMACFYPSQPYCELMFTELSKVNLTKWKGFYYSLFKGFFPSLLMLIFVKLLLKSRFKIFKNNDEASSE
jgi:membrane protease YdiL (CAAX protease family)